ncbi:TetR/AcrR family transcriptional regulator [Hoeflea sp.]|uniref:TetR/AcrR family transcriptional regulator n=1 Tax=Hoeflea sp. TaxID=1940281 RepID=UPI00374992B7
MRVSRQTAEKNRETVVRTASEQFRTLGYDGIGIANLMKAAGLTQGGFYKQFKSKDALEIEATRLALQENHQRWAQIMDGASDPIQVLKDWYLSPQHVSAVGKGCTYATLGAEATRQGREMQQVFGAAIEQQVSALAGKLGDSVEAREDAIRTMAQMVGTLILARAVSDADLQDEILQAGKGA